MKILVTGSGGREHAIIQALQKNSKVEKIFCAPGNGGTAKEEKCENIAISDMQELAVFAEKNGVNLAVPGSEDLLVAGIADLLIEKGISVLGPHRKAALLEGSKCFAKDFMEKYGIKTAAYKNFTSYEEAVAWLDNCPYPTVLKADGLAAGKGVLICANKNEARKGLKSLMLSKDFGEAGSQIVIEEYLEGVEASILSLYDGKTIVPMLSAKDHKKIGENETGPNTGGMGVVSPNPHITSEIMKNFEQGIMESTRKGLEQEKLEFTGVIFFGLMITEKGIYLLEYNLRMGDPETQAVLNLLDTDLLELIEAAVSGSLSEIIMKWKKGSACCVVLASGGYPGSYKKGYAIKGIEETDCSVYIAGAVNKENQLITAGGRVLNVVAVGENLYSARKKVYENIERIDFTDKVYRKDIGGPILF